MSKPMKAARAGVIVLVTICLFVLALPMVMQVRAEGTPTTIELETALHRDGLNPEALAAAGLSASDARGVVQRTLSYLVSAGAQLTAADHAAAAAKRESQALERLVRSGRASQEEVTACQQARSDFDTAQVQQQTLHVDLFEAATAGLSGPQVSALTQIRLNRGWKLSPEYLVVSREEAEWVRLRSSLASERIAAKRGESTHEAAQAVLDNVRGDAAVAAAMANLDANLSAVRAAWDDETETE